MPPTLLDPLLLSTVGAWLVGALLHAIAVRRRWSRSKRRIIPRVAIIAGAALGYGVAVLAGGGTARDAVLGALGGAAAIAYREAGPRLRTVQAAEEPDGHE